MVRESRFIPVIASFYHHSPPLSFHIILLVTINSPKSTRVDLSILKKIEILNLVQKGKMEKEVCLQSILAPSALSMIIKNEQKLWDEYETNSNSTRLHIQSSSYEDLEQALVK